MRPSPFFIFCAAVVVWCLMLGGGTRPGFLSDVVIQLLAIPLLLTALWRLLDTSPSRHKRVAALFALVVVALPLLQVVPLPPSIWTKLPNRELAVEAFTLLDQGLPWMPISVSPHATWLSALSFLPPLAIFLSILLLDQRERRALSLVVLGVGVLSVFIGLVQVAQGPASSLRFFEETNESEAVGFFANRNHYAALLYGLTLLTAAWAVETAAKAGGDRQLLKTGQILVLATILLVLVVLVAAQAMARSRAGLGLTILALLGGYALAFWDRRIVSGITPAKLLAGATALAVMFVFQFALYRVMQRFSDDPLQDARIPFARNTIEAAKAYMPFGSGMGTFTRVYGLFERPQDALANTYANRAHNDVLELWLETGVFGLGLMAIFVTWLAIRAVKVWRLGDVDENPIDRSLARAATVIVTLLIVHSFVDYPLRTTAMAVIFVFACGLLVEPHPAEAMEISSERAPTTRRAEPRKSVTTPIGEARSPPTFPTQTPKAIQPRQAWGQDVDWPDEWRKK